MEGPAAPPDPRQVRALGAEFGTGGEAARRRRPKTGEHHGPDGRGLPERVHLRRARGSYGAALGRPRAAGADACIITTFVFIRLPNRSPSSTAPGRPILARPPKKVSRAVGRALHTVGLCCARLGRLERKPILQKGQDGSPIECQRPRQRFRGANKKTQEKNKALASVETLASKSPGLAGGLLCLLHKFADGIDTSEPRTPRDAAQCLLPQKAAGSPLKGSSKPTKATASERHATADDGP